MSLLNKATFQNIIKNLNENSQILLRADFNVPIKNGTITDPKRMKQTIPTIKQILKYNPKSLVILSHMGRPNGERVPNLSLKPIVPQLQRYLNRKINFLDDFIGQNALNQVKNSKNQIFLCQNVRFYPQQVGHIKNKNNSKTKIQPQKIKAFQNQISKLGNIFVNDAFGAVHRNHSSVTGINHKYRVAGLLMQKQLKALGEFMEKPKRPVLAILGGAKVTDKLLLVRHMLDFADQIILGGGMKNPFLTHVFKRQMGASINIMPQNPSELDQIVELAKKKNKKLIFPVDYRVARSEQIFKPQSISIADQSTSIPKTHQVFDIGPEAGKQYDEIIQRAGSIFWNGPVGVIQTQEFRKGSEDILRSMIKATKNGAKTIIGGGDSASLVTKFGVQNQLSFVSTGGGATIQLFEGKQLPGIKTLSNIQDIQK